MKKNTMVATPLSAPGSQKRVVTSPPGLVFLASLSLYVATAHSQVVVGTAVELPPNPPGLDFDLRCEDGDGDGPVNCPLENDYVFIPEADKYLEFDAYNDQPTCYTPFPTNTTEGIGVDCASGSSLEGMEDGESLDISVLDSQGELQSSTPMTGIYLNGLENRGDDGCYSVANGRVIVQYDGDQSGDGATFLWSADASDDITEFVCDTPNPHAIFVGFDDTLNVRSMEIVVDNFTSSPEGDGVFLADMDLVIEPGNNVNQQCFDEGEGTCEIILVPDGGPVVGNDLKTLIKDSSLMGNVALLDGFPVRVRDDRAQCQKGASGLHDLDDSDVDDVLIFNGVNLYNVNGVDGVPLELVVSDNSPGTNNWFTVSAKACGVPRAEWDGDVVPRSASEWSPYIDIVAIESDIDPVASILEFEAAGLDGSDYQCESDPANVTRNQPFFEINARDHEMKYLKGTSTAPGVIDDIGRDIMTGCGSKRSVSRRFSFLAWNLIHAPQADLQAEIGSELQTLIDTATRTASCVTPSFYYQQLAAYPIYAQRYYDYGVLFSATSQARSRTFFLKAAEYVDQFTARLQNPGVSDGLQNCYATGDKLDGIKNAAIDPLAPGDKPLNAFGDLVAQSRHLSYEIRAFINILILSSN